MKGAGVQEAAARRLVCIILPTYNEAENVAVVIPAIFAQARRLPQHELKVLVVDDNSPDGTQARIRRLMVRFPGLHLITGQRRGLGDAYRRGMAYACRILKADLIFEMDADLQHPPEFIPRFVALAEGGFSLVIGSRFAPGGDTPHISFRRRLLSRLGNWMVRSCGGISRVRDCTSGYRCIRSDLLESCNLSLLATRGYAFQSSLLWALLQQGARVAEIPITFPGRRRGASKLSLRDQIEFLLNLPMLRLRRLWDASAPSAGLHPWHRVLTK